MAASRRLFPIAGVVMTAAAVLLVVLIIANPFGSAGDLPAWHELDARWGTYLSEREWGTPREAIGSDGWGLTYAGAVGHDYSHGEDGIAGLVDREGTFHLGWALWDDSQPHVSERLDGVGNPEGIHGEEITDRRVFGGNTPTSSYHDYRLEYPAASARFAVMLAGARADDRSGVLEATIESAEDGAALHLVLKAWFHDRSLRVELVEDGLLMHGPQTAVAIIAEQFDSSQVSADKAALDERLRQDGELSGNNPGHIGALHRVVEAVGGEPAVGRFAWAEDEDPRAALERARTLLLGGAAIMDQRRTEASDIFAGQVTSHEPLYRGALTSLLWSQSLYRWDGRSGAAPGWEGRVDARDVLIMPDKWEFPWLATWDTAFHAVIGTLIDPDLGADQLLFLFSDRWQQPDGALPCAEWVMHSECPPVFAWAAWQIHEAGASADFLETIYPGLAANHDHWWRTLAVEPDGLFTCGFCGMDNLPRGAGQAQADASAWMAFSARHLAQIADTLGDADAAARYRADVDRIARAVNAELWNEERGFYFDRSAGGQRLMTVRSYSGLIPLIAGIVPPDRAERVLAALRDEAAFLSPHGIRSTAADSEIYEPGYATQRGVNSSWRGPIWLPINYLLVHAVAEHDSAFSADLRERLVAMVEADWQRSGGRFHEYFDAETGEGLGADAQAGWTALVANLIVEGWPAD